MVEASTYLQQAISRAIMRTAGRAMRDCAMQKPILSTDYTAAREVRSAVWESRSTWVRSSGCKCVCALGGSKGKWLDKWTCDLRRAQGDAQVE